MIKFDTHIHTKHSLCSLLKPERILQLAEEAKLDEIVVKDHNTSNGALEVKQYEDKYDVKVEIGNEVKTEFGELGLDFLSLEEAKFFEDMKKDKISFRKGTYRFQAIEEGVQYLRNNEEGSRLLVCLHHPFSLSFWSKRGGFDFYKACGKAPFGKVIEKKVNPYFCSLSGLNGLIDYTELNANNLKIDEGRMAVIYAATYKIPIVCSTDSHFEPQIGRYYTIGEQDSARDSILKSDLQIPNPEDINYKKSRYYRTKSGLIKKPRKIIRFFFKKAALNKS